YRSLIHPFQQVFEAVEPAFPEPGKLTRPVDQWSQGPELRAIVRLATVLSFAHQPGPLQDPKVLRDGGVRHPGWGRQSPNRLLTFATQSFEDSPPSRIGERSEERIVSSGHLVTTA